MNQPTFGQLLEHLVLHTAQYLPDGYRAVLEMDNDGPSFTILDADGVAVDAGPAPSLLQIWDCTLVKAQTDADLVPVGFAEGLNAW